MARQTQREHVITLCMKSLGESAHAVGRIGKAVHQEHRAAGFAGRCELV